MSMKSTTPKHRFYVGLPNKLGLVRFSLDQTNGLISFIPSPSLFISVYNINFQLRGVCSFFFPVKYWLNNTHVH